MDRGVIAALRKPKESAVGELMRAEQFTPEAEEQSTEGGEGGDTQG